MSSIYGELVEGDLDDLKELVGEDLPFFMFLLDVVVTGGSSSAINDDDSFMDLASFELLLQSTRKKNMAKAREFEK